MQDKLEVITIKSQNLLDQLNNFNPDNDKVAWIKMQNLPKAILKQAFIGAAQTGQLANMKAISQIKGVTLDISALYWAVMKNNLEIIKFLCTLDDINPAADDNNALCLAAENGFLEIVEFLCTLKGIDPTANDNLAFRFAAENGHLKVLCLLSKIPGVDPAADDNSAIGAAAGEGHLEVVKFLCTLKDVDPTADNHEALRSALKYKHLDVANYLASLPCYNPFAPDITIEQKIQRFTLLKELKLENHIVSHRIETNKNILSLFFKDPNSLYNKFNTDVKSVIVQKTVEIDNYGLAF